jgi:hypothetical protein
MKMLKKVDYYTRLPQARRDALLPEQNVSVDARNRADLAHLLK